ncbi:hypothetical protein GOP47_0010678 [Adiantum capillus-veneris]|uniref:Uncharacterized protein n=1 Tax=Adiantum capillus-veneris TaxID=13818 RepID=A0A9D4UVS2_ADICA|nr:hypothetical protein GOP47_0010678 [Adiantum capillus-veneris]
MDPLAMSTPPCNNLTSLLHFVGDGSHGLLGYCNNLVIRNTQQAMINLEILKQQQPSLFNLLMQNSKLLQEQTLLKNKILSSKETIVELEKEVRRTRIKTTPLGLHQRCRSVSNIETLKVGSGGLKQRIQAIRGMVHPEKENIDPQMAKSSYSSLIAPHVAKEILDALKFKKIKQDIISDFLQSTTIDTLDVQSVIDNCGISQKGYSSIFKSVKI